MDLPHWLIPISKLVISEQTSEWCRIPYPRHPKGCPNYGHKKGCPPDVKKLTNIIDLNRPMYIIHSEFDLSLHMQKMKLAHPHWTERQLRNVLYWQGTSRKQLRGRILNAQKITHCNYITTCPEARGLNVFGTCLKSGLKLDKTSSIKICRHVAIMGFLAPQ